MEWVEWSGMVTFRKSDMYAHHQIGLNELINMVYFIFNLNAYSRVIVENVRKMTKNGDLKTRIYGSKNISS